MNILSQDSRLSEKRTEHFPNEFTTLQLSQPARAQCFETLASAIRQ